MADDSGVYHEGELAVQALAGERDVAERHGTMIKPVIVPGARPFLEQQELIVLAAGDRSGEVWVTAWFGARGFVRSTDEGAALAIDRRRVIPGAAAPVTALLEPGAAVGVLAIELGTRRRLRVNGTVSALDEEELAVRVRESFPNCPKYIAKRRPSAAGEPEPEPAAARGDRLDAERRAVVLRSDTVFVGSLHPERGADASHRGGDPGFVRVIDDRTLRVPDYAGNGMFQTLGNLHATRRAGLAFLDFEGRRLLHVTGETELRFDEDESRLVTGGTGRSWDLHVARWVDSPLPAGVGAELLERSRFVPRS